MRYIKVILLLSFMVISWGSSAHAWSCIHPYPSNTEIISAPIIFEGKITGAKTKNGKNYYRYTVNRPYKGIDSKVVDILGGNGSFDTDRAKNYKVGVFLPSRTKDGDLYFPRCRGTTHLSTSGPMAIDIRLAYSTPFPNIFLILTSLKTYVFSTLILIGFVTAVSLRRAFIYLKKSPENRVYGKDFFWVTCAFLIFYALCMMSLSYIYLESFNYRPYIGWLMVTVGFSMTLSSIAIAGKHYNGSLWFICLPHIYPLIMLYL